MYDTIGFKLTNEEVQECNFLAFIPQYLESNTIALHNYNGLETITGNINNLSVSVNRYQVTIKKGSFCKWYLGSNYHTMQRQDTQRAIEKLSDTLHLPINKAKVTRLDLAQNFILKHPIQVYLNHLGHLRYYKRLEMAETLCYIKQGESLCFYDKNKEQRANREAIPELYQSKNVLRYEKRFLNRLPMRLKVPRINGALLYNEDFYISLVNNWYQTYMDINKINELTMNFESITNKKEFYTLGVLSLVERAGGVMELIKQIDEQQKNKSITRQQAYTIKQTIKEACNIQNGLIVENEAIKELNKKIKQAVQFYR